MATENKALEAGQLEVAIVQYQEVRSEIARVSQAKTALIGLALTATSAITAYGFSAAGRREVLLILPYVLGGLALIYLNYGVIVKTNGDYIRDKLWPFIRALLPEPEDGHPLELPCWETWNLARRLERGRSSSAGLTTLLGQGIIFGVPAIAALVLTFHLAWSQGWSANRWIWLLAALVLVGTVLLISRVELIELSPRRSADCDDTTAERDLSSKDPRTQ